MIHNLIERIKSIFTKKKEKLEEIKEEAKDQAKNEYMEEINSKTIEKDYIDYVKFYDDIVLSLEGDKVLQKYIDLLRNKINPLVESLCKLPTDNKQAVDDVFNKLDNFKEELEKEKEESFNTNVRSIISGPSSLKSYLSKFDFTDMSSAIKSDNIDSIMNKCGYKPKRITVGEYFKNGERIEKSTPSAMRDLQRVQGVSDKLKAFKNEISSIRDSYDVPKDSSDLDISKSKKIQDIYRLLSNMITEYAMSAIKFGNFRMDVLLKASKQQVELKSEVKKIKDEIDDKHNVKADGTDDTLHPNHLGEEFKKTVNDGNVRRARIMIEDQMLLDPTMVQPNNMIKYAEDKIDGLYDDHEDDENYPITQDKSKWDEKYMDGQMAIVVNNFSKERVKHLKQVVQYLYPDKIKKINEDRKRKGYVS